MALTVFIYVFIAVFLVNLIPVFGPPTWMVLSFFAVTYPIPSFVGFVLTALVAASLGRFILLLFSKHIIRNRLFSEKYRENMDYLRKHFEKRPRLVFGIFFIDAITPLPSDQLFIAYGLTGHKARYALIPFIMGRAFTYSFWTLTATEVIKQFAANSLLKYSFFSWTFIWIEVILLVLLYFYVKIDWEYFIVKHKLRLINHQR